MLSLDGWFELHDYKDKIKKAFSFIQAISIIGYMIVCIY